MGTSKARAERRALIFGGGYGNGAPNAKEAGGKQPVSNVFQMPKQVGITTTSKMYPNNYYVDFDLTVLRAAADQVMKQGQTVNYATLTSWVYESSAFVQSLFNALGDALMNIPIYLKDENGNVDKKWTREICEKLWFNELRTEVLFSNFWGFSGINFDPIDNRIYKYPMQQIDPLNRMLRESTYNYTNGTYFEQMDNLLFVQPSTSYERFLGWMQPIARQFIYMNLNNNNWVQAGKRLAFPFISIGYPVGDGEIKDGLYNINPLKLDAENYAANLDPAKALVSPYTLDADGKARLSIITEVHESTVRGGLHKIFQDFNVDAKNEVREMILGGTLTSDAGKYGTHGLGDVHEDKLQTVIKAKNEYNLLVFNNWNDFRRKIKKFYRNLPDNLHFDINREQKMSVFEITAFSNAITASGNKLKPSFFVNYGFRPEDIEEGEKPMSSVNEMYANKKTENKMNKGQLSVQDLVNLDNAYNKRP